MVFYFYEKPKNDIKKIQTNKSKWQLWKILETGKLPFESLNMSIKVRVLNVADMVIYSPVSNYLENREGVEILGKGNGEKDKNL